MKKIIIGILSLLFIIIVIYYFKSDYIINYEIKDYKVKEQYKNNKYYFEIKDKNNLYNFDYLSDRKITKKEINSLDVIKDDNYTCILPKSNKLETYPLCYIGKEQISYDLVLSSKIKEYFIKKGFNKETAEENSNKNFQFYNNLDKKEYIAVWKYNGFYIMNENNIKTINLFKKDRYSNDLCYLVNKYLVLPNYDEEHEFKSFYIIDIITGKYKKIESEYSISYESYIAGINKKNVYLFDKKYKNEYEIKTKKEKITLIGNEKDGYIKYKDKNKLDATLKEFNNNKTFNMNTKSDYIYNTDNNLIKIYKENKKYSTTIFKDKVNIINTYKDKIYFTMKDTLYEYYPKVGNKKIIRNFEWNFNLKDTIFIFNK